MAKTITAAAIILSAVIFARAPLLSLPFERDEGEYAYTAQVMMKGSVPYKDVFDQKPPAIFFIYLLSFLMLGQNILSVHMVLAAAIFAGAFFLYLSGKRLQSGGAGLVAALGHVILSSHMGFEASSANTEHFMNTAIIIAVFFLIKYVNKRSALSIFASGLLLGIAFIFKPPAAVNIILLASVVIGVFFIKKGRIAVCAGDIFIAISGFAAPFAVSLAYFGYNDAIGQYMYCVFLYNMEYSRITGSQKAIMYIRITAASIGSAIAIPMAVSLFSVISKRGKVLLFLAAWLALSFLGASAGLMFRRHYFIQIIPPLALLSACGLERLTCSFGRGRAAYYSMAAIIMAMPMSAVINNHMHPADYLSKVYFGTMNHFVESVRVGNYIRDNSSPADKILVIGSDAQIYFYARRQAATKYIYMYPLFLKSDRAFDMQVEALKEIQDAGPKYIIFINEYVSFLATKESSLFIIEKLNEMVMAEYSPVGCVVASDTGPSRYYLGEEYGLIRKSLPGTVNNLTLDRNKPNIVIFKRTG